LAAVSDPPRHAHLGLYSLHFIDVWIDERIHLRLQGHRLFGIYVVQRKARVDHVHHCVLGIHHGKPSLAVRRPPLWEIRPIILKYILCDARDVDVVRGQLWLGLLRHLARSHERVVWRRASSRLSRKGNASSRFALLLLLVAVGGGLLAHVKEVLVEVSSPALH